MAEKPILFNTEMVKAILDGRKTQTRRVCKGQPQDSIVTNPEILGYKPPYNPGDILWVRETWCRWWMPHGEWHYCYKASNPNGNKRPTGPAYDDDLETRSWRPSIHMPREAARLFLLVKAVRCERLLEIETDGVFAEGIDRTGIITTQGPIDYRVWNRMQELWDSTVKKTDLPIYGWDANPWVWVIEFERIKGGRAGEWADRDTAQYADAGALMLAT